MTDRVRALLDRAGRWRTVLLVAGLGLALLLWPTGGARTEDSGKDAEEARLASLLEAMEGVGQVRVLLSDSGAAVVCQGADSVSVRLNVTDAVRCYTGLGADRIVIIKMNESWRERS